MALIILLNSTGWMGREPSEHYSRDMHCTVMLLFYLYSKEIVAMLSLKPGLKVLDVGCGIGGSGFYMVKVRVNYYSNNNNNNNNNNHYYYYFYWVVFY